MTQTRLPEHRPEMLGSPFEIILVDSVMENDERTVTIPDMRGMMAGVGMARLWRDDRLSGRDLVFLRKSVGFTNEALASAIGVTSADMQGYEGGPRPMTLGAEKLVRMHLFNALRRLDGPRIDQMINYLEWVLDEWVPTFSQVHDPITIRMRHHPTGWGEVRG